MTKSFYVDGMEFAVEPMSAYDSLVTLSNLALLVTRGKDEVSMDASRLMAASPLDLIKMFDLSIEAVEPVVKSLLKQAKYITETTPKGYGILLKDPLWNGKLLTLLKLCKDILVGEYSPFLLELGLIPNKTAADPEGSV